MFWYWLKPVNLSLWWNYCFVVKPPFKDGVCSSGTLTYEETSSVTSGKFSSCSMPIEKGVSLAIGLNKALLCSLGRLYFPIKTSRSDFYELLYWIIFCHVFISLVCTTYTLLAFSSTDYSASEALFTVKFCVLIHYLLLLLCWLAMITG